MIDLAVLLAQETAIPSARGVDSTSIFAIGVGFVGLAWSIYAAGRDKRAATLTQAIDRLELMLRDSQAKERALYVECERLAGVLARHGIADESKIAS